MVLMGRNVDPFVRGVKAPTWSSTLGSPRRWWSVTTEDPRLVPRGTYPSLSRDPDGEGPRSDGVGVGQDRRRPSTLGRRSGRGTRSTRRTQGGRGSGPHPTLPHPPPLHPSRPPTCGEETRKELFPGEVGAGGPGDSLRFVSRPLTVMESGGGPSTTGTRSPVRP